MRLVTNVLVVRWSYDIIRKKWHTMVAIILFLVSWYSNCSNQCCEH